MNILNKINSQYTYTLKFSNIAKKQIFEVQKFVFLRYREQIKF